MVDRNQVDKAVGNIAMKKQQTLFDGPPENVNKPKKQNFAKQKVSYWLCQKGHIFRHNYAVMSDKMDLHCTECNSLVKMKSTKNHMRLT